MHSTIGNSGESYIYLSGEKTICRSMCGSEKIEFGDVWNGENKELRN